MWSGDFVKIIIMNEIWKDISTYEGIYQVSSMGHVKSLDRLAKDRWGGGRLIYGKMITIQCDMHGYRYVHLYKNSKGRNCKVHLLVAKAFIENINNLPFINHIDGDKSNNCINNLEWCTQSENEKHAHQIGLKNHKGENHPRNRFTNDDILEMRRLFDIEKLNQREIGRIMNINYKTVHKIVHRQRWAHI